MWSLLYDVLEATHPGSFDLPEGTTQPRGEMSSYFSLVTITTVGYGDITPVTRRCQGVCQSGGRGRATLPGDPGLLAGGDVRVPEIEVNVPAMLGSGLSGLGGIKC